MASRRREQEDTAEMTPFEAGQDTSTEEEFSYDEEQGNLVADFKKHPEGMAALKRLSEKCLDDFNRAWEATEKFRKNMADTWKLFTGILEPKPPPYEHLANAHVPILLENTIRMVFRQSNELFGNWTNVFGVTPVGPDDEHVARLLSLHGNWQIRKRIKDFKRQVGHRGLLIFDLFGDVTCHSYWDPQRRSNRHEILTANEFVCANAHVSTMPDYSDVSWVAKILFMDGHELRKMAKSWEGVTDVLERKPPMWEDGQMSQEFREAVDKSVGVDSTAYQKGQYRLIQYEGWLNLPGQEEDRYCKVIVDTQTRGVLALSIHERIDPYEKRRFEFQTQELERFRQGMQEVELYQQELVDTERVLTESAHDPNASDQEMTQMMMAVEQLRQQPPPQPPPMPDWMNGDPSAEPDPPGRIPIRMFAHGVNIEPIQGILGIGTGAIHAAQNKAANIALSMFIDQGTMGNIKTFLMRDGLRFPEKFTLEPGKVHRVVGSTDLSRDIIPLDFGPANPQLIQLVEMLVGFGNSVSNTPEVLSGEAGKSGETATGISSRIEQAVKMMSVPTGKYADFATQVLINNGQINALFLPDVEFFSVNNHDPILGQLGMQSFSVGREMYDRDYDVEISADLKFTSTVQRISEADALVQMPNAVPELQGNFAFKHATVAKSLEARARYDLVGLIGQAPEPPPVYGAPTSPPAPPPGAPQPGQQGQPPQQGGDQPK